MTRDEAEQALKHIIVNALTEYPDLAGTASQAIGYGVERGVERVQEEANKMRNAMTLALALMPPARVTEDLKKLLEAKVREAIGTPSCGAEQDFFKRTQE